MTGFPLGAVGQSGNRIGYLPILPAPIEIDCHQPLMLGPLNDWCARESGITGTCCILQTQ